MESIFDFDMPCGTCTENTGIGKHRAESILSGARLEPSDSYSLRREKFAFAVT